MKDCPACNSDRTAIFWSKAGMTYRLCDPHKQEARLRRRDSTEGERPHCPSCGNTEAETKLLREYDAAPKLGEFCGQEIVGRSMTGYEIHGSCQLKRGHKGRCVG